VIVVPHFKNCTSNLYMYCTRMSNCSYMPIQKLKLCVWQDTTVTFFTIINSVPGLMNPQNVLMLNILQRGSWRWLQWVIHSIHKQALRITNDLYRKKENLLDSKKKAIVLMTMFQSIKHADRWLLSPYIPHLFLFSFTLFYSYPP
jgi:hypothetical protein